MGLRSIRLGLAAIIPNLLPVGAIFSFMGIFDVPLDLGTAMTAAVALGIAVDDTLHFLVEYRAEGSLEAAAESTGRAIVASSLIVGLGFCSLLSADFGPTRNFGLLCAVAMVVALVGDLVVLPFGLSIAKPETDSPVPVSRR